MLPAVRTLHSHQTVQISTVLHRELRGNFPTQIHVHPMVRRPSRTECVSSSLNDAVIGINDLSIECPSTVVRVASLPPHNMDSEPGVYSEGTLISDPMIDANQTFDTYAIDAGHSGSDSMRDNEQNVLIWLVGELTDCYCFI
jgi:hypothetical protein